MNYSQDPQILNEVQIKLGCKGPEEAQKLIGRILHVFRDQLSEDETDELIDQLPSNLVLIFLSAWELRTKRPVTKHLDQFVNRVITYDRLKPHSIFRTEIEALRATLIILHELDKRYHLLDYLSTNLRHEVQSALMSEAA